MKKTIAMMLILMLVSITPYHILMFSYSMMSYEIDILLEYFSNNSSNILKIKLILKGALNELQ